MKKFIALAVLSVAGLGMSVGQASAWWFYHYCCNKCCTTICLQPYNAFSPVCCGNLACNGCCPMNITQGCGAPNWGYNSGGWGGSCGATGYDGCVDGSCSVGQLPILDATQQKTPAPATSAPTTTPAPAFQGPMPTPKTGPTSYIPGLSSGLAMPEMIQTVGYQSPTGSVLAPVPNAFNAQAR